MVFWNANIGAIVLTMCIKMAAAVGVGTCSSLCPFG